MLVSRINFEQREEAFAMIDFKEEIQKYKPVMEIDEVESAIQSDEIKDLMDILQYIIRKIPGGKGTEPVK